MEDWSEPKKAKFNEWWERIQKIIQALDAGVTNIVEFEDAGDHEDAIKETEKIIAWIKSLEGSQHAEAKLVIARIKVLIMKEIRNEEVLLKILPRFLEHPSTKVADTMRHTLIELEEAHNNARKASV